MAEHEETGDEVDEAIKELWLEGHVERIIDPSTGEETIRLTAAGWEEAKRLVTELAEAE